MSPGLNRAVVAVVVIMTAAACSRAEISDTDARNFHLAIDASNSAMRITNRYTVSGASPSAAEREDILRYTYLALEHARATTDAGLDAMHDDMRRVFRTRFEHGVATIVAGIEARDPRLLAEGHLHLDRWADWVESARAEIKFPPQPGNK